MLAAGATTQCDGNAVFRDGDAAALRTRWDGMREG